MSVLSDVGSAAAFVVSAYSLYQTTLKRAGYQGIRVAGHSLCLALPEQQLRGLRGALTLTNEGARAWDHRCPWTCRSGRPSAT